MLDNIQYDPSRFLRSDNLISSFASCTACSSSSGSYSSSSSSSSYTKDSDKSLLFMLSLIELGFLNYKLSSYVSFSSILFFYLFSSASAGLNIEGLICLYISI